MESGVWVHEDADATVPQHHELPYQEGITVSSLYPWGKKNLNN